MSFEKNLSGSDRESISDSDSDLEVLYSDIEYPSDEWLALTKIKAEKKLAEENEGRNEGREEECGNTTPVYVPKSPIYRPSTPQNILPLFPNFNEEYGEDDGNVADTGNYHLSHIFLFFQTNIYLIH